MSRQYSLAHGPDSPRPSIWYAKKGADDISGRDRRSLVATIREELIDEHEQVLRAISAESREAVITAMTNLLGAFRERQSHPGELCDSGQRATSEAN